MAMSMPSMQIDPYRSIHGDISGKAEGAVSSISGKVGDITGKANSVAGDIAGKADKIVGQAADKAASAGSSISNNVGEYAGKASGKIGTYADKISGSAGDVSGKVGDIASKANSAGSSISNSVGKIRDSAASKAGTVASKTADKLGKAGSVTRSLHLQKLSRNWVPVVQRHISSSPNGETQGKKFAVSDNVDLQSDTWNAWMEAERKYKQFKIRQSVGKKRIREVVMRHKANSWSRLGSDSVS